MLFTDPHLSHFSSTENLRLAWWHVRKKKPGAGPDGIGPREFADRLEASLASLQRTLKRGSYRPGPVRVFRVEKKDGGTRPIVELCVADRVVERALYQVLAPLFDATFEEGNHAYRPGHSTRTAVRQLEGLCRNRLPIVAAIDIERCFESIPHRPLIKQLRARTSRAVTKVVRAIIEAHSEKGSTRGLAQGSVLSPLLCNVYLDRLDKALAARRIPAVRYADNLFLPAENYRTAKANVRTCARLLGRLDLKLNAAKTHFLNANRGAHLLGLDLHLGPKRMPARKDRQGARGRKAAGA